MLIARLRLTVLDNPFVPHLPHPKQARFLMCEHREVLFGGAAGGGKSDAMLMAALQYVHEPNYSALILRRTYPQLSQEGGLMPRSQEWLAGTDAVWNEQRKTWTFPSGAVLAFGHMAYENTKYDYQSGEYQFIGFEELTQFSETQYTYMHSRTRRLADSDVPIRVYSTSNPGGVGHEWVRGRFIDNTVPGRCFIASSLDDNPSLDRASYVESLMDLDPVTRAQLLMGDWTVRPQGAMFHREWFEIVDAVPAGATLVRFWDEAGTEATAGKDPDWTVGAKVALHDGTVYIADIARVRATVQGVDRLVRQTAELDGIAVPIRGEQEPGSAGKARVSDIQRRVLAGFDYRAEPSTGSKAVRAAPLASQAEAGNVKLVRGPWNAAFLDEACAFPLVGFHDDQIDAAAGGYQHLASARVEYRNLRKPQGW